ncbi:2-amino-4-hydroxy-6-hydroxymethyldihydropteridine diphosphokinase [Candidatus Marinamargulisbacteria bacterium SCGC AG-410-N11]|nr:2-amino-4-hydroxy-6-hydroxymethyldihydropteridine diphosphokinase [Candidatus Marinamargulisbacteria bacterium SCGC AG-410-N11]
MINTVYLSLGSNIGNRKENILNAVKHLNKNNLIEVENLATIIETKSQSNNSQPNYLNTACKIKTLLTPLELLSETQKVEIKLGRKSKGQGDPRTIDIDIIFYEDQIIIENHLTIPHPLAHLRDFVLIPMNEIEQTFIHPILQEPIYKLYDQVVKPENISIPA